MVLATQACFDAVNAQGGVRGRQLRAVAFDDGDRLDASVKRVQRLVYMLSVMGTQSALRALGACAAGPVSFIGLQAYINTKVLLEGLRCAGRDLSRSRAVQALESLRRLDIGGVRGGLRQAHVPEPEVPQFHHHRRGREVRPLGCHLLSITIHLIP